jgi:hypothetical protein
MTQETPIAVLRAAPGRRVFACAVMLALGGLLILSALTRPPAPGWQVFLLVCAAVSLLGAEALRRATRPALHLHADALRDSDGTLLTRLEDVARVERGAFAFKPSNGFVLHLRGRQPRAWQPGLWWRMGKRLGVGGTVSAGASRFMADQIALRLSADND